MWWHEDYFYRRRVAILAPPELVPAAHIVTLTLGNVLFDNGKVREDFEDIEVIYEPSDGEFFQMYRIVDSDDDGIHVTFQVQDTMEENEIVEGLYHVYYGNPDLVAQTPRLDPLLPSETLFPDETLYPADTINPWPVGVGQGDAASESGYGAITYTRPGEHWKDGVSSTRYARASLLIYATAFRIVSSVGPDQAIMEVQVDGGDWEDVDLYASEEEQFKSVIEKFELDPDIIHEIRIRVSGRANISSLGDEVNIKGVEYVKPVKANDLGEEVNEEAWSSSVGGGE